MGKSNLHQDGKKRLALEALEGRYAVSSILFGLAPLAGLVEMFPTEEAAPVEIETSTRDQKGDGETDQRVPLYRSQILTPAAQSRPDKVVNGDLSVTADSARNDALEKLSTELTPAVQTQFQAEQFQSALVQSVFADELGLDGELPTIEQPQATAASSVASSPGVGNGGGQSISGTSRPASSLSANVVPRAQVTSTPATVPIAEVSAPITESATPRSKAVVTANVSPHSAGNVTTGAATITNQVAKTQSNPEITLVEVATTEQTEEVEAKATPHGAEKPIDSPVIPAIAPVPTPNFEVPVVDTIPATETTPPTVVQKSEIAAPIEVAAEPSAKSETPLQQEVSVTAQIAVATVAPVTTSDTHVPTVQAATSSEFVLSSAEVQQLLNNASQATASDDAIIAVVDRAGNILGVRVEAGVAVSDMVFAIDGAVAKARTASFFSSNQAPLTSRTVRFISQTTITQREVQSNPNIADTSSTERGPGFVAPIGLGGHFPPGVAFTPHVDLFAIEHTNRDSLIQPGADHIRGTADDIDLGTRFGADYEVFAAGEEVAAPESYGFVTGMNTSAQARGIATLPGGVPLYKETSAGLTLVGGIGVFFPGPDGYADFEQGFVPGVNQTTDQRLNADRVLEAEFIAFNTADTTAGFSLPRGRIDLVGIKLEIYGPHPFGEATLNAVGQALGPGVSSGTDVQVTTSAGDLYLEGKDVPDGWLVEPKAATDGSLTAAEVREIIDRGVAEAELVRAAIRLPRGERTRMVLSVTDTNGEVLGLFRMPDATYFSIDVAVAKARNVAYHADATEVQPEDLPPGVAPGTAFTNRTYRYLAEPFFPSGIDGTGGGAYSILNDPGVNPENGENLGAPVAADAHTSVLGFDAFNPGSNFREPTPTTGFQNGVVFFPGSTPLYKDGKLVGGFGVSGDGVDQDDVVTFSGSGDFRPDRDDPVTRADEVFVDGVRLPFQKFLRNPRG